MKSVALLSLMLWSAAPRPDEPGKYDDAAELKPKLSMVTDGKGHYVALDPKGSFHGPFFYGDGKTFYLLRSSGGGASGTDYGATLWDPRIDWNRAGYASFDFRDGKYSISCPPKTTPMTRVPDADAARMLAEATLFQPRWLRLPHRLARDDNGIYYFVDCARDDNTGFCTRDWRLYTGQRGKLKQQQMTNIVSDSVGQIFSTRGGELRLVLNDEAGGAKDGVKEKTLKWVNGKQVTPLINVPVEDNARMIFSDLGVYDREKLGTPCDDL